MPLNLSELSVFILKRGLHQKPPTLSSPHLNLSSHLSLILSVIINHNGSESKEGPRKVQHRRVE